MTFCGDHDTERDGDRLLDLQLRVARRADELALVRPAGTRLNLHCWLLAEIEVLGPQTVARGEPASPVSERATERVV